MHVLMQVLKHNKANLTDQQQVNSQYVVTLICSYVPLYICIIGHCKTWIYVPIYIHLVHPCAKKYSLVMIVTAAQCQIY